MEGRHGGTKCRRAARSKDGLAAQRALKTKDVRGEHGRGGPGDWKRFSRQDFEEHVLNWSLEDVLAPEPGNALSVKIPSTFSSTESYVDFLRPLVIEEVTPQAPPETPPPPIHTPTSH